MAVISSTDLLGIFYCGILCIITMSLQSSHSTHRSGHQLGRFGLLALGALGVVFGDIGTSPLYTINEIFFGHGNLAASVADIYGGISLVIWGLTTVVLVKYVLLVLRADNEGQGGVFALYGLIKAKGRLGIRIITWVLLLAAGFLFGDGLITPAISVLSAVEGLKVATPTFEHLVVPITIVILTILFAFQHKGTAKVGSVFGPIVTLWFIVIAILGARQIIFHPAILNAFNPWWGASFLGRIGFKPALYVLGFVMLAFTGGEALYADLGHFGIKPIRVSWFFVVYPALLLIYLGQGAYLISGAPIVNGNVFYSLVPTVWLYPVIALATMATVIASQALISGAFSLAKQGIALNFFPRLKVIFTHASHQGQIYVPLINWSLYVGCVIMVLVFRSSTALASAYGLAESGVMLATSLGMLIVAKQRWHWSAFSTWLLFGFLAMVDMVFLFSNSLKFFEGGFIPLTFGVGLFIIMTTWQWGRRKTAEAFSRLERMTVKQLLALKKAAPMVDRTMIIMDPKSALVASDRVTAVMQFFWERYQVLPKHIIFLTVAVSPHPYSHGEHGERYDIVKFKCAPGQGSVTSLMVNFGFMEEQNVEAILQEIERNRAIPTSDNHRDWIIELGVERLIATDKTSFIRRLRLGLFHFLRQNSQPAHYYYGLGNDVRLAMEVLPVKVD